MKLETNKSEFHLEISFQEHILYQLKEYSMYYSLSNLPQGFKKVLFNN